MELSNTGLVSIIVLILISIAKDEIRDFFVGIIRARRIYKDRTFDLDGNPESDDVCLGFNPATGEWGLILIHRYNFWTLSRKNNGVDFSHVDLKNNKKIKRHKSFEDWDKMEKAEVSTNLSKEEKVFLESKHIGY